MPDFGNKYSFRSDYLEGCHPKVLEFLVKSNDEQLLGYGEDAYTIEGKNLIKNKLKNSNAKIFFVAGGTQANLIVISTFLKSHQSVICASTGHIQDWEAGAIEATGHKINSIQTDNGKITVKDIEAVLKAHEPLPHLVKPKMVYISNSTELGTIYHKKELEDIYRCCKENKLLLYLDGARIGSAMSATDNDVTFADLSANTDIFYLGGSKNGGLLGEAIILNDPTLDDDFIVNIKQKGALMAKGRLLGIQFLALFKDDLYFELARHANEMAAKIIRVFTEKGFLFLSASTTNQLFPILPNSVIAELAVKYDFSVWQKIDEEQSVVRFVTSWATKKEAVDELAADIYGLKNSSI